MSTILFDEIVPGATVRFADIDGVQYLSVCDVIKHLCDKTSKRANEIWLRLPDKLKEEVAEFCDHFQFPGQGGRDSLVISFKGAHMDLQVCRA